VVTVNTGTMGTGRAHDAAIRSLLHERGVRFDVCIHPRALSGIEEARAIGVEADEVLKTLVLDTARGHVLLVLPASRRIDMRRVRAAVGDSHAKLATEEEVARDYPDFELAAIPPLGSMIGQPVFVDATVLEHETVIFAAGSQTESLMARTEDLFRDEDARAALLTRALTDEDEHAEAFG
jgi:Ala-tRNA(Pro) deacylase